MLATLRTGLQLPACARRSRLLRGSICGVLICVMAAPVMAQKFKSIQGDATPCRLCVSQGTVPTAIKNPAGFGADQEAIDTLLQEVLLPHDDEPRSRRPSASWAICATSSSSSISMPPRILARKLTLTHTQHGDICRVIAIDNFHPSGTLQRRLLIIGSLDSRYGAINRSVLPEATGLLLELLEKETMKFRDKDFKIHPVVKSGALIGLQRHALHGVANQYEARLTKAMLDVIARKERPEELSKDVDDWMKCQAMAVLVHQFKAEPNAQMQNTLNAMAKGEELSLDDRCYVTSLMEVADYEKAQEIDGEATLGALSKLTQDVLRVEAKLAKDLENEILEG